MNTIKLRYGTKKLKVNHGLIPASRQRLIDVASIAQVSVAEVTNKMIDPSTTPIIPVSVSTKNNIVTIARINQVAKYTPQYSLRLELPSMARYCL
jgi:hypothetical protein